MKNRLSERIEFKDEQVFLSEPRCEKASEGSSEAFTFS